jgi:predicted N-acetyltransferase YhbS
LCQEHQACSPFLSLGCRPVAGGVEFCLRDQGLPFDPQLWSDSDLAELRGQVDRLEFVNLGHEGKETRLRKYFALRPEASPSVEELDQPVPPFTTIRAFQAEDAEAVSRCVWRTYGYSYTVLDAVYLPERLANLNATGKMFSLVALNADHEIIGHLSWERSHPESSLVTAGTAAVEPQYRSQGVASKMARHLLDCARQQAVGQIQCFAVTSHPYSQRLVHSLGFRCCSLILGASLFYFEGLKQPTSQRESLIGYYQALDESFLEKPHLLYAPNRHRAMLESLCQHLGLNVQFEIPGTVELCPGDSVIQLQESPPRKLAKIHVERYGLNVLERLRSHARYLRMQDYRYYQLSLPLSDPYTYHILKPLEKMGFFFSGLGFRDNSLCLVLQDLYGVTLDYSQIQVEDEMARELLGYVRYLEPEAV